MTLFVFFLAAWPLSLVPSQARAAIGYCGPAADARAVEALTTVRALHDRTRIMYLAVLGNYAMSDIELKGEQIFFFIKRNGRWTFLSNYPDSLPPAAKKHFDYIIDAEPHPCENPNFVNHPSGR